MKREHIVTVEEDSRHLRSLLEELLLNVPNKGIRRAIQRGQITVNNTRVSSNHKVNQGDRISIHIQTITKKHIGIDVPILQEDDHYAIINKPAGLAVSGGRGATVSTALPHVLIPSMASDALAMARTVHRLDKPTSGLLLVAKTKSALANLSKQFEAQSIEKTYTAIVHGRVENAGKIDIELAEKVALTYYTPLKRIVPFKGNCTVVDLTPKTGRTHQLRKHMAYIGHPIIGDRKYGKNISENYQELMLCATKLIFEHPQSNEVVECEIAPPKSFFNIT